MTGIDPAAAGSETGWLMRILTRHVLVELAKVFVISLVALTMVMIIVGVLREAMMQNLPAGPVLRMIPYILPDALRVAVPVTLLLAVTSVYGRMSGANEVVATKALGISPMAILWPTFITAFLLSLITVWLNDLAVSWGRRGAQRVMVEAVEEIAYAMLKSQKSYSSPSFSINVEKVIGPRLIRPIISFQERKGSSAVTITADEAQLQVDHAAGVLKIILHNSTVDVDGRVTGRFPGIEEREVPMLAASRAKTLTEHPSSIPLGSIPEQTNTQLDRIHQHENELAAKAAYQMLCGDFDGLTSGKWKKQVDGFGALQSRLFRLRTEPHRRWSAGFSCLFFAWVGMPMAILLRKSDFLTAFFLCFLPILVVYYPLLAYGVDVAKNGTVPPYAVWTGNVLLVCWGTYLLRKVIRY